MSEIVGKTVINIRLEIETVETDNGDRFFTKLFVDGKEVIAIADSETETYPIEVAETPDSDFVLIRRLKEEFRN